MEYYVVTAVSEEDTVHCVSTDSNATYSCLIPQDSNVNDYNFTAYAVTIGIDGTLYNGMNSSDCCKIHRLMQYDCF